MKYYYNKKTKLLLIDENDYTPYLKDRGYEEITKEEYDRIIEEQLKKYKEEHPEELESIEEEPIEEEPTEEESVDEEYIC